MKLAFFHYHPFNRPSHKGITSVSEIVRSMRTPSTPYRAIPEQRSPILIEFSADLIEPLAIPIKSPPHLIRTLPHLDRVPFNSDIVPAIFDTVSTYLDSVSTVSDTVFIISNSVSTISNTVSSHFNRVSSIFDIIAGSPMTHSLQRAGLRYRSPVHRLNRLLHTCRSMTLK